MKVLYIYNSNSNVELSLIERANEEMKGYINLVSLDSVPELVKNLVTATPCLLVVTDDLQGNNLLSEDVDGKLLSTAMLYKRMEEEDKAIHQAETFRLDNMIKAENTKAIDNYTLELVEGGLI
jgi:hypothetical protein